MAAQALFSVIKNRRSIGKLSSPAPTADELLSVLELAMTAPDHKVLKPYRFVLLQSQAEKDKFAQSLLKAGQRTADGNNETLDEAGINKLLNAPNRAPVILVCISDYKAHPKVSKFEQVLAMGAFIQTLLLGLEGLGYKSIWRSGPLMNEQEIKDCFGVDDSNDIAGFVYMGSSDIVMPERDRVAVKEFLEIR